MPRENHAHLTEKAVILLPELRGQAGVSSGLRSRLSEIEGLARALDVFVEKSMIVRISKPSAATFLGKGKVQEVASLIEAENISLAIIDHAISPVQQRNLELAWQVKVVDRVGVILKIFGKRAKQKRESYRSSWPSSTTNVVAWFDPKLT